MKKIVIMGLVGESLLRGSYEMQLGNVGILIPMLKHMRAHLGDVDITTTINLTEKFCHEHQVNVAEYVHTLTKLKKLAYLIFSPIFMLYAVIWRAVKSISGKKLPFFGLKRLSEFAGADIVLDFNGDVFPADVRTVARLLLHLTDVLTISCLGVPMVEFVSSPGPFNTSITRFVSKVVYGRMALIMNREEISSGLLRKLGVTDVPIIETACPSFLLEPGSGNVAEQELKSESVDLLRRPLIGMNLCGYNLPQHTWGIMEDYSGLDRFVPAVRFMLDELSAHIVIIPHVHWINPYVSYHEFIHGPDYEICLRLAERFADYAGEGSISVLRGCYSAKDTKAVIGRCDLFVSGRLHAGIAALSQAVPTVYVAYGHKHKGVARIVGQEEYVVEDISASVLTETVKKAWGRREDIRASLKKRLPRVEALSTMSFEILRDMLELPRRERISLPKELVDGWRMRRQELSG